MADVLERFDESLLGDQLLSGVGFCEADCRVIGLTEPDDSFCFSYSQQNIG